MTKLQPCVLIYNPISGHGHLDSWNALFVGLLLERGFRVLALTPDRMALETRLTQRKLLDHPRLHVLDWDSPPSWPRLKLRIRRIWQWWLVYGHNYANKRPETRVTPGMPIYARVKKRVFQILVPLLFRLSRAFHALYRKTRGVKQTSGDPGDSSEISYLDPVDMARRINAALMTSPWRPDCMFNMYLDMYKTDLESWRQFAGICRLPWGGIRFVPSDAPPREGYYALPSLRGVCFMDEAVCRNYSACISDKRFQYLPDVTNTELPEGPSPLVGEILHRAARRKIVFLGGFIGGQKNIARWRELISLADPRRWFFIQVGEIHANTFNSDEILAFERLVTAPPENVFLYTEYLLDERDFNAVIQIADVLFAVYRNFHISSNMLSKAAYFKKPIMACQGVLMGRQVEQFGIGVTVPEQDSTMMHVALERLVAFPPSDQCYANFRAHYSAAKLASHLESFIGCCLEGHEHA